MKVRRNLSILCQVIIGLLLALSIQSCGIGVSEKEETVIQEILDIYGGTCMMHKGKTTGTEGNKTYFELEISGSPGLEAYKEYHPYMAGIIAHQFYTGLAEERKKYSHIKVTLRYEDGDWHKYEYSGQQILEFVECIPTLKAIVEIARNSNYETLESHFVPEAFAPDAASPREAFLQMDSLYGASVDVDAIGFAPVESEFGEEMCYLVMEKRNRETVHFVICIAREPQKATTISWM